MAQSSGSLQTLTSRSSIRFIAAGAAPPKPHLGNEAGGAGSLSAKGQRRLATVPLCWRPNASPFWIMLLLSSRAKQAGAIGYAVAGHVRRPLIHSSIDAAYVPLATHLMRFF